MFRARANCKKETAESIDRGIGKQPSFKAEPGKRGSLPCPQDRPSVGQPGRFGYGKGEGKDIPTITPYQRQERAALSTLLR